MDELVSAIAFTLAPLMLIIFGVFIWHLWLAPCELAYEASKDIKSLALSAEPEKKPVERVRAPVNWAIWRERSKYTVEEFAAILAKNDPMDGSIPHQEAAFKILIMEQMEAKLISYIPQYMEIIPGKKMIREIDSGTEINKDIAISWAEKKNFDVSHVK